MPELAHPDLPSIALLDQLATPLVLLDAELRTRYANPACASWLGLSLRRLVDQTLEALEGESGGRLAQLAARVLATGHPMHARHVALAPQAGVMESFADIHVVPLANAAPMVVAIELHPVAEFPGVDPAVEMPAALSAALKGLAHEVRNPLAGLQGATQLLGRRLLDPDARRYLDVITAESTRLSALVERLLVPQAPRPFTAVNVHEVLERVRVLAESDAGWAAVVQRDYDPSLPELAGDTDRLVQAIWNLVRNALESGSSEIRLRTRAEREVAIGDQPVKLAVRVDVIDNGRGVPEDLGARIFLPLVSGRAEGTGLGLPLAQGVAREHHGALSYRSRPGHTVFTLLLPVEKGSE